MMVIMPFFGAMNSIILRKMKDLSEYSVGSYTTLSFIVLYGPIVYFGGYGMSFIFDFDSTDWILTALMCIVSFTLQICKIKACQYEEPAKLAVVSYF